VRLLSETQELKGNLRRAAGRYSLSAGRSSVDLDQPDFEALVHHEVEAEELEALVGQVLGADRGLNAGQTAPVKRRRKKHLLTPAGQTAQLHLRTQPREASFSLRLQIKTKRISPGTHR